MKNVKLCSLVALLLLVFVPSIHAEVVSIDEARTTARQFMQNTIKASGRRAMAAQNPASFAAPFTLATEGEAALYVFNRAGGGYVIVSAESDTQREVLGWSDSGTYDPAHVPAPLKAVLDSYADGIRRLRKASPSERELLAKAQEHASKAPQLRRAGDLPAQVEPLLGDIEWGQGDPYARLVPTYMSNGSEYHYPTGCVATAIAQVMMYHRWPEQGRGSHSYEWNGQTLSADFNHAYRWDLMLPAYRVLDYYTGECNYTEEQALEVARLMYDVGVSVNMYYNESGSGANFSGPRMAEFFDYDKNTRILEGNYCSTEDWEDVMRTELAAARPVLCCGGSQGGAHEFVCDGYNAEGLFHYNFGWNGAVNGWFASTATGYDASPSIDYGIEKNHGGTGVLSLMSCDDFVWTSGNDFAGNLILKCSGLDYSTSTLTIEVALAAQNVQTGQVTYHAKQSFMSTNLGLPVLSFNDEIPDGTYEVYPVGRLAGEEEWQTFYHNAMRQIVVDLTVSGGVKTWANNHILDPIDEGVVLVDGIYYVLDEGSAEASVTRRNERGNSYGGDVVIPDKVTYEGRTYAVTSVGERAFEDCADLNSLVVGKNVAIIGFGALGSAGLSTITFAEGSQLQTIGGWAFNGCNQLSECHLPEGVTTIGMCAFQSCYGMRSVSLPASVTTIASCAFNGFTRLQTMQVAWTSFNVVYVAPDAFGGNDMSGATLVVPKGCADLYRSDPVWCEFNIVEDGGNVPTWSWTFDEATGTLTVSGMGQMAYTGRSDWSAISDEVRRVVLGEGITSVPGLCFWSFRSLASVVLPSTMKTISYGAFYDCPQLTDITCLAPAAPDVSGGDVFAYMPTQGTLTVPAGADYSTWLAVLPEGWTISYIGGGDNPDDDPLVGTFLYVLGCDNNWNPAQPSATLNYRAADKCYVGDITIADANAGNGYFCLGTKLGSDSNDWGTFNANRLGAPYSDYLLTAGTSANFIVGADASFCAPAGTHHLVVDTSAGMLYFDCPDGIRNLTADENEDTVYDLFGRRVTNLQPGTLYLKNGRKLLAK